MAGRGFQKIGSLADAKELRKLNDQLYLLWYKVLGRIEDKDIDTDNFSLELNFAEGGTLTVGGTAGGILRIQNAAGVTIGELNGDGLWIDEDRLAVRGGVEDCLLMGERNFCGDHAFEDVDHGSTEDGTHHDFLMSAPAPGNDRWEIDSGAPRVLDDGVCSDSSQRYVWFGNQAVACSGDHRVSYTTRVDAARNTYAVSLHAWPHYSRNAGGALVRARLGIGWLDGGGAAIGTEAVITRELTGHFAPGTSGRIYHGCRFSATVPRPDTARFIQIRLLSPAASEWVCYDGVQIAPGEKMQMYRPEDGCWQR